MRARDNPFAVGRFDRLRYRFPAGQSMETLVTSLRELGMRGAIVGPEGHGKSTLLSELEQRLRDETLEPSRLQLRAGQSSVPDELSGWLASSGAQNALLLDGAEQLSTLSWLALRYRARRLGAFVITSHVEGRLPTVIRCETSPALLAELLDELAPDRPPEFPSAESLWLRHRGDIRQAMFDAYDRWTARRVD